MLITGLDLAAWSSALDRLDPPQIDVFAKLDYIPTPKQQLFHDATEFDVLFGGSLGGGKTRALTMEAIRACIRYPGIRVGAFRRTYGELKESLLAELMQINYAAAVRAKWNGSDYELRFPNGSVIMFRYAETMQDATRRQGGQYQLLIFDERTLTPPDVVSFLESRLRSGRKTIPVLGIRSSANPGGPGHGRVRVKYVDATNYGTKVIHDERGRTIRFIPSRMEDNPHLNPEYENDLLALPEVLRRALREGDWGVFSGQVFCYDNRVEILTGTGWKPVSDVAQGEPLATLAPDGEMTFEPATHVWQFDYDGDLYIHEGRAVNFAVTPGHRMWTRSNKTTSDFRFVPVEDLPDTSVVLRTAGWWQGRDVPTWTVAAPGWDVCDVEPETGCRCCGIEVAIPRKGMCDNCYRAWNRGGRPDDLAELRGHRANPTTRWAHTKSYTFDTGDWCELIGWYLSEGFTHKANRSSRYAGRIYGFGISQIASQEKIDRICMLLDGMGLKNHRHQHHQIVNSRVLGEYFAQFGHHEDKFVPRELLDLPAKYLQRMFDALMAGDGCRIRKDAADAYIYVTTSRQLADDVQELCVRIGRIATIKEMPAEGNRRLHYRVSVYQSGHDRSLIKRRLIKRQPYTGPVSCVTVEPHHTVLVRRGGKAMWCGNSELSRERHVVAPITLPATWQRYNGVDWGYAKPWAVLWAAVDEDGRVWIYRELYSAGVGEADQAKQILAAEGDGEHVAVRYADDAMWATRGDAKPIATVYAENGVHLTEAGKGGGSRIIGWQRVHSYLDNGPACPHHRALGWTQCPMLHIFDTVENLWRELRDLPHATKGDPEDADTTASDHACLVAGTMVATRRGEVPIERVTTRDAVMTRSGWRRVLASGLTGVDQPVVKVYTSNGRCLTLTPSHPVWVINRGWVRADGLRYSDKLVGWSPVSQSSSTGSPSADTPTPIDVQTGSISRPEGHTDSAVSADSIKKYGKPNTATSPMVITSTTVTKTRSTTRRATSFACLAWIIFWSTALRVFSLRSSPLSTLRPWPRPLSGTAAPWAGNGTASTVTGSGLIARQTRWPVSGVGACSAPVTASLGLGSAQTGTGLTRGKPAEWTTRTVPAWAAARRTGSIGTPRRGPAPVRVVKRSDAGRADVYNLTVEGEPEFFANGVLTHNCDSLRYLLINLGTAPRFHFPPTQTEVRELDPQATGPRPPQPLPKMYGGFPVQTEGTSIWG